MHTAPPLLFAVRLVVTTSHPCPRRQLLFATRGEIVASHVTHTDPQLLFATRDGRALIIASHTLRFILIHSCLFAIRVEMKAS